MSNVLERLEGALAGMDDQWQRRTLLGKAVGVCAAVASTAAGLSRMEVAEAANFACCNLAYPNNICSSCACNKNWDYCWYCCYCAGGRQYLYECCECYENCKCSDAFVVYGPCAC